MKRISLFLFTALFVSALPACGPAPAAPTTTATDRPMPTVRKNGENAHIKRCMAHSEEYSWDRRI